MNQLDELLNNTTLAPLQESFYEPKNLSSHDTTILAEIAKTSIRNIESSKGALQHLLSNIQVYQSCMIDAINLQAEAADLTKKYTTNPPKQSYTLPGIESLPNIYNLQDIKSDNERMQQIKDSVEKITDQKQLYMKLMQQDFKLFLESYKRLCYSDQSFSEFVESLNSQLNQAY